MSITIPEHWKKIDPAELGTFLDNQKINYRVAHYADANTWSAPGLGFFAASDVTGQTYVDPKLLA